VKCSLESFQKLISLGLSTEQMAGVLDVLAVELANKGVRSGAAERQARFRAKKKNESVTSDVTSNVTCNVTDNENSPTPPRDILNNTSRVLEVTPQPPTAGGSRLNGTNPRAVGTNPRASEQEPDGFDAFWAAYPKRDGNADRKGAVKAFSQAIRRAGDHSLVTRAAARYAAHCREKGKLGTEFVKQARSWLNGDFWREWLPQEPTKAAVSRVMVREGSPAWDAWKRTGRRFNAMDLKDDHGHVIGRGWYFETEFPAQEQAA
jgi:hypothetical protein